VVFFTINILPAPKQHPRVIEILRSVCDLTRLKPGCLGCWLSEEDSLHDGIQYVEQWDSADTLREHIRSDLYRRVLAAMELSRQPPEASFHYVTTEKGFELVETLRTNGDRPGDQ